MVLPIQIIGKKPSDYNLLNYTFRMKFLMTFASFNDGVISNLGKSVERINLEFS